MIFCAVQQKALALLLPTSSYRNEDFLAAATALNVEITPIANYCHQLAPGWGMPATLAVPFDQPQVAFERLKNQLAARRFDAILAVDDSGVELAALLNEHFGLIANSAASVRTLRDKLAFRNLQHAHGFPAPKFAHFQSAAVQPQALDFDFPVVVKPRRLSASRGVIRADNALQLSEAVQRVLAIQAQADRDAAELGVLVEEFIPGAEYAFEGMLDNGRLTALALFDKPDPLNGPYFEETLYVTPSRLAARVRDNLLQMIAGLCAAAGLRHGPIHAEARINGEQIVLLEIAPRSIGGLCGRVLRYTLGISIEDAILRNALRLGMPPRSASCAAGVMMIPIPRRGLLASVEGMQEARKIPLVEDIVITSEIGQLVTPPPEGASYLGFIFARGDDAQAVEHALRQAHQKLRFEITAEYPLRSLGARH